MIFWLPLETAGWRRRPNPLSGLRVARADRSVNLQRIDFNFRLCLGRYLQGRRRPCPASGGSPHGRSAAVRCAYSFSRSPGTGGAAAALPKLFDTKFLAGLTDPRERERERHWLFHFPVDLPSSNVLALTYRWTVVTLLLPVITSVMQRTPNLRQSRGSSGIRAHPDHRRRPEPPCMQYFWNVAASSPTRR